MFLFISVRDGEARSRIKSLLSSISIPFRHMMGNPLPAGRRAGGYDFYSFLLHDGKVILSVTLRNFSIFLFVPVYDGEVVSQEILAVCNISIHPRARRGTLVPAKSV